MLSLMVVDLLLIPLAMCRHTGRHHGVIFGQAAGLIVVRTAERRRLVVPLQRRFLLGHGQISF